MVRVKLIGVKKRVPTRRFDERIELAKANTYIQRELNKADLLYTHIRPHLHTHLGKGCGWIETLAAGQKAWHAIDAEVKKHAPLRAGTQLRLLGRSQQSVPGPSVHLFARVHKQRPHIEALRAKPHSGFQFRHRKSDVLKHLLLISEFAHAGRGRLSASTSASASAA